MARRTFSASLIGQLSGSFLGVRSDGIHGTIDTPALSVYKTSYMGRGGSPVLPVGLQPCVDTLERILEDSGKSQTLTVLLGRRQRKPQLLVPLYDR